MHGCLVKQVRKQNAGMSFKNVLMLAKNLTKNKGGNGVAKFAAKFEPSSGQSHKKVVLMMKPKNG